MSHLLTSSNKMGEDLGDSQSEWRAYIRAWHDLGIFLGRYSSDLKDRSTK